MTFIETANLENLRRCARNTELAPGFDLDNVRHECGSYGCLIGNDAIAMGLGPAEIAMDFGGHFKWATSEYGFDCDLELGSLASFLFGFRRRQSTSRESCLGRLYKAIAYVKRKRALLYEPDGRVKESARRQEGDHFIVRAALSSVPSQGCLAAAV